MRLEPAGVVALPGWAAQMFEVGGRCPAAFPLTAEEELKLFPLQTPRSARFYLSANPAEKQGIRYGTSREANGNRLLFKR